ncbi:hypothetical protein KOR34_29520 [Posidoniimonas corsicana]|uniref:Uncharacterized protein n=1 Tax=Posidoniimonas corsicana TaxID=1938618 RepID=A0A5C5VH93_9BACT|nr:hypothetical protein [Posidoniimonas corsicana]TWT37986.1 hypothetical protein KOR34_29520 [Posidoniimonas corsicana]
MCGFCRSDSLTTWRVPAFFDYEKLAHAIATREWSYRLLLWISRSLESGLLQPSRAGRHYSGAEAAALWIESNLRFIPAELRPPPDELEEFTAFFSTYLTSSFDVVVEQPDPCGGIRVIGYCDCQVCRRIQNASHLRAKRVYARDKRRAALLMAECLTLMAMAHKIETTDERIENLLSHPSTRQQAAFLAFGHWLVRRLSGDSDGPAVLALWRMIAWDPRGGMRRGFVLGLGHFRSAERALLASLRKE